MMEKTKTAAPAKSASKANGHSEQKDYVLGKLRFSTPELKIYHGEQAIHLTQREGELLRFFCEHANQVLRRQEILINIWGKDDYFLGRSMDVFITKLRKHFKLDPSVRLETLHGVGFRLIA